MVCRARDQELFRRLEAKEHHTSDALSRANKGKQSADRRVNGKSGDSLWNGPAKVDMVMLLSF